MMTDILDYFQADLDALRSLIYELRIAEENSREEADAFTALVSLFTLQAEAQESVLRPLTLRSRSFQQALAHSEERNAGALAVENMIECCTNRATWRASVNVYCEMLETKIWQDSRELLPALYDNLSARERIQLGQLYRKARGFGRTITRRKDWQKIWASVLNHAV